MQVLQASSHGHGLALRTGNSESDVIMADGVDSGHKATDVLAASG
jgi:hypothetical protein